MTSAHLTTTNLPPLSMIRQRVGNTPLFRLDSFSRNGVSIFAKLEWEQLGGSVKARPAAEMLARDLELRPLRPGERFLEATSGNTGIAFAQLCQSAGYPITIVLPSNASKKRIMLLEQAGAEIIFSSPLEGTDGAQVLARSMAASAPKRYRYLDQYNNSANYLAHYRSTGPEIWEQTNAGITHFITGLGTSGSFTGTSQFLKERNPDIRVIALQPDSPMHGLEGWKHMETAIVPGIYDPGVADEHRTIATEEALSLIPKVYEREGLWISPSAAANLAGAIKLAGELEDGTIVTLFPDDGSKYLETFNPFRS